MTEADEKPFRAIIAGVFSIAGHGLTIALEDGFDGNPRQGDFVSVPLLGGTRSDVQVKSMSWACAPAGRRKTPGVGLVVGDEVDKGEVLVGGEVVGA